MSLTTNIQLPTGERRRSYELHLRGINFIGDHNYIDQKQERFRVLFAWPYIINKFM